MKQGIKERIEIFQKGNVSEWYIKTKIGIILIAWGCR